MSYRRRLALLGIVGATFPVQTVWAMEDGPAIGREDGHSIVVTARKRDETLLESPLAISVIDGGFLDVTGFAEIEQLADFVPGFTITPAATTRATGPKIRGISTFSFSDGFESSVATVVDGVGLGREAQGYFDLFDIAAIEVVKGPQGTMFGSNASAGLVKIRTRAPEFEFGGFVEAGLGSFAEFRVEGAVTGPLSDQVAIRVAGARRRRGGLVANMLPQMADLDDKDSLGLRIRMLAQPSDQLTISASIDYADEDDRCCVATFRRAGAPTPIVAFALNPGVAQLAPALDLLGIVAGPDNRRAAVGEDSVRNRAVGRGVSLTATYDLGSASVTAIAAWRRFSLDEFNEPDGLAASNVANGLGSSSTARQFSQEIRLVAEPASGLDLVAGAYLFDQRIDASAFADVELALPVPPFFNVRTAADSGVAKRSLALFAEGTQALGPRTAIILGGRVSRDRIRAEYLRTARPIVAGLPFGAIFGGDLAGRQDLSRTGISARAILRHFLTDNLAGYATLSRGYKSPGIDVALTADRRAVARPDGLPVLPAEVPMLREIGLKGRWDGFAFGAAAFDQDLHDLQTIQTDTTGVLTNLSIDRIAARGVEVDFDLRPLRGDTLALTGSLAMLDIAIAEFAARPDLEGRRFRDAARWSWSLAGTYRPPIGDGLKGLLRIEAVGRSGKNSSTNLEPFAEIPGHAIVNLRLGLSAMQERLQLLVALENLFDTTPVHFVYGSPYRILDRTSSSQFLGPPRRFGLTAIRRF